MDRVLLQFDSLHTWRVFCREPMREQRCHASGDYLCHNLTISVWTGRTASPGALGSEAARRVESVGAELCVGQCGFFLLLPVFSMGLHEDKLWKCGCENKKWICSFSHLCAFFNLLWNHFYSLWWCFLNKTILRPQLVFIPPFLSDSS